MGAISVNGGGMVAPAMCAAWPAVVYRFRLIMCAMLAPESRTAMNRPCYQSHTP